MSEARQDSPNATTGYLLVLAATIIWSGNFIVSRAFSDSMPPVTLAFLRWSTAIVVLLPFGVRSLWREREIVRKHLGYIATLGFLGVTMFNTLVYIAGHTTGALNMALIATSTPVFVILLSRLFLGEAITVRRFLGLAMAVSGVVLLVTDGKFSRLLGLSFAMGDVWMVLAAALFAVYSILVRKTPPGLGQRAFLTSMFVIGWALLTPWFLWEHRAPQHVEFSWSVLGAMLYLGVGASLLAFLFWNRAVAIVGPANASFVYYTLPLFSGCEALLLLGEPVDSIHLVSGLFILGGIVVATRN